MRLLRSDWVIEGGNLPYNKPGLTQLLCGAGGMSGQRLQNRIKGFAEVRPLIA
ncbi:hypothetical protein ACWF50_23885 [Brucella pseudogrignonensis]